VMNHGWIVTLADPDRPDVQVSLMTHDATARVVPDASVEVDDMCQWPVQSPRWWPTEGPHPLRVVQLVLVSPRRCRASRIR
jgi:hypothetical protein